MNKLSILVLTGVGLWLDSCSSVVSADIGDAWAVGEEITSGYNDYTFTFTYDVSNALKPGQAGFLIYSKECRSDAGGTEQLVGFNTTSIGVDGKDVTAPGGATTNIGLSETVEVPIILDPHTFMNNNVVYTSTGTDGQATIEFCIIFTVSTEGPSPVEINYRETIVTLLIDMTDDVSEFSVAGIQLEAKDRTQTDTDLSYSTLAYLCDPSNPMVDTAASSFVQGQIIDVCIRPDDVALADNIVMSGISDFSFEKVNSNYPAQVAIGSGAMTALTTYDNNACEDGTSCSVSAILLAYFYETSGTVSASGSATLKFPAARRRRRRLGGDGDPATTAAAADRRHASRVLQDDDDIYPFDLSIDVTTTDDGPTVLALAAGRSTVTLFVSFGTVIITTIVTSWI